MNRLAGFLAAVVMLVPASVRSDNTNVLIIPKGDGRGGAIFFVDECLTRGLTNTMSVGELRKWATNTIITYREREATLAASQSDAKMLSRVEETDIPEAVRTMQDHIPSCRSDEPVSIDGWDTLVTVYSEAWAIPKEEASRRLRTIGPDSKQPRVGFLRSTSGAMRAVTLSWYIYGVMIGPESFTPEWEHAPWYHRKLADGIYLWYGYK
jgi:hypothetical protein